MLFSIDFNSDEAIYIQLCNQIILEIANDNLREGDNLPPVREMAELIGINMHTVNKAYSILKQEGYLKVDRRKGTVISLDLDKIGAINELKNNLRGVVARALCKNMSGREIHEIMDEVLQEFGLKGGEYGQ